MFPLKTLVSTGGSPRGSPRWSPDMPFAPLVSARSRSNSESHFILPEGDLDTRETVILGHKQPDTDSVASAIALADLRNQTDPESHYVACVCGNLNDQTKFVLTDSGHPQPRFLVDVYPKVSDVMTQKYYAVHSDSPLFDVIKSIQKLKIRLAPVVDSEKRFEGLISIFEIAEYLMTKDVVHKQDYVFRPNNFVDVMRGEMLQIGQDNEFSAPLVAISMEYEGYIRFMEGMRKKPVVVTGNRKDIIADIARRQCPAIVLCGLHHMQPLPKELEGFNGWIFKSDHDTAETLRLISLCVPVAALMNEDVKVLHPNDYVEDARKALLNTHYHGLPVLDETTNGLVGVISRQDIIQRFQKKVILVDHNEKEQAIEGIETAEVVEIVDHHRLNPVKTTFPVSYFAKPVGSTCTLVWELFKSNNLVPSLHIGKIMLAGILADTVIGKSPTTTMQDLDSMRELAELTNLEYREYGKAIFSSVSGLADRDANTIILTDFKEYAEFKVRFGIGQIEVVTLRDIEEQRRRLTSELYAVKGRKGLDWAMLLITDIVKEESILIMTSYPAAERLLQYHEVTECIYHLPHVLSRKKQLLPELLRVLVDAQS